MLHLSSFDEIIGKIIEIVAILLILYLIVVKSKSQDWLIEKVGKLFGR